MLCRLRNRFRMRLHICNSDRIKSDRGHRQTPHRGKPLFKVRHQPQLSSQYLIQKPGCRKYKHERNEYVHKTYLPAFPYFSIPLFSLIFPLSGTFLCQSQFFFYLTSSCISTPPIVSISAPQERVTICANGSSSIRFELLSTATFPEPPMFVVHIPAAIDDSNG